MSDTSFAREMLARFGATAFLTEARALEAYGKDWTNFVKPDPLGVALPRDAREVSEILALCARHSVAVVPSGGRTGLAGGAVAARRELVLNLERLNSLGAVNPLTRTVRVGAGAVNQRVQDHCAPHGLFWPVELGSKGSCQVGGNLATNAGGVRVIRYGHARNWAQSLEVVLASGEVLELNGELEKNNTGYDLRHLLIGSEGTLGVITSATLKLAPIPRERDLLFFGARRLNDVLAVLRSAREADLPLLAFECLTRECLESVRAHAQLPEPLGTECAYYGLVDIERGEAGHAGLEAWVASLLERGLIQDGTLAQGAAQERQLWRYREGITESLAHRGLVYKNDLALPLNALESFAEELRRQAPVWYPGCSLFLFGHVGDGNLHVNVLKPAEMEPATFLALCERANDPLFALVADRRGSIAAEHGVGLLKKSFLRYSRPPAEIELLRGIKRALDPHGRLNPGKIFD